LTSVAALQAIVTLEPDCCTVTVAGALIEPTLAVA
jgi:hypothetical protein